MSKDCLFCKIAAGEIPCYKIYEDDNYLAFLDIFPTAEAHTLLIPKKHYDWVWDIAEGGEFFTTAQQLAKHFRKVSGQNVIYSIIHGEGVNHAHIHLFPKEEEKFTNALNVITSREKIADEKAKELVEKFKF